MNKTVLLCAVLAGCAGTPAPCPEGQARTNAGQCVAIAAPPTQSLADFDPFPQAPPAPSKAEYVDHSAAIEFNRQQAEKRAAQDARDDAEWRADQRTERIVDAQRDTQRAVQDLSDEVRP